MLRLLRRQLASLIEGELEYFSNKLKQIAVALLVVKFSFSFWVAGGLFLLLSLFFMISQSDTYAYAALVTGLVCWAAGIILTTIGLKLLKTR